MHLSNLDRWKHNIPCGRCERDRACWSLLRFCHVALVAMVVVAGIAVLSALAHGQERPRTPSEIIVFSLPSCAPCQQLKLDVQGGRIGQRTWRFVEADRDSDLYREFEASVRPTTQTVPDGYIGQVNLRPQAMFIPIVWARGSTHFWMGYTSAHAAALREYLDQQSPPPPRRPLKPATVVDSRQPEEFDGVHLIVVVSQLTDSLPEMRSDLARRADRVLQSLAETHIGSQVRAALVAEVTDVDRYHSVCNAVGLRPSPAACFVLIPEKLSGMKAILVGRAHAALGEHFLLPLQSAGVHVILERLHGPTYDAVLDVVLNRTGEPSAPGPAEPLKFLAAAWLGERSNLARRLLARLGFA